MRERRVVSGRSDAHFAGVLPAIKNICDINNITFYPVNDLVIALHYTIVIQAQLL